MGRPHDERQVGPPLLHIGQRILRIDELQLNFHTRMFDPEPGNGRSHQRGPAVAK